MLVGRDYISDTVLDVFGCQVKCLDSSLPWAADVIGIIVKL